MNLIDFSLRYSRLVLFGLIFTFFSSFGQTFLVSLFLPGFTEDFSISNAYFGSLYSSATLLSAGILVWVGAKVDIMPLRTYALMVSAGLALSAGILAATNGIWMLFAGLFGIRLFGQGLCSHTAHTAMGRYFITMRGRAISLANLGFNLGEGILPVTMAAVISLWGWRAGWGLSSLFIGLTLPALIILILRKEAAHYGETSHRKAEAGEKQIAGGMIWRRSLVLRDKRFYMILPGVVISPFLLTGLFLYQTSLAEFRGWEIEVLASAFIAFASSKAVFSLVSGPLIDRYTALSVFPFFLIPLSAGLIVLSFFTHHITIFIYLFFAGMTEGFGFSIKTSLYAELYGTRNLGAIRSMMAMFMVLSSAISPVLFGIVLDTGISFGVILYGAIILVLVSIIPGMYIYTITRHRNTKNVSHD